MGRLGIMADIRNEIPGNYTPAVDSFNRLKSLVIGKIGFTVDVETPLFSCINPHGQEGTSRYIRLDAVRGTQKRIPLEYSLI